MRRVAIVGATGAVGVEICRVLAERRFPVAAMRLLASPRSAGRVLPTPCGPVAVEAVSETAFRDIDIAFFSAGTGVGREYAPIAVASGAVVIDNSSAFRADANVPLVVPEINAETLTGHRGLIANPNCSAIIMTMAVWPLHREATVRRIVVSTYQAASGAGARALAELESQTRAVLAGEPAKPEVFKVPCAFNVFSHNSSVRPSGFNGEEEKVIQETRRILGDTSIQVAPTCVRVPVYRAHTESVAVEFSKPMDEARARELLGGAAGLRLVDDREQNRFPTPLEASGRDEVLVGRIRQDPSVPDKRGLLLLCAGDQLRKGAALNAVQIAELLS